MRDLGVRCEEHVGEVFPPRCSECERLQQEAKPPATTPRWPALDPADEWESPW
jgi:hypothetical protein